MPRILRLVELIEAPILSHPADQETELSQLAASSVNRDQPKRLAFERLVHLGQTESPLLRKLSKSG